MFSRSDPFSKLQVMREVRGKVLRSESEEESSFINSFRDALVHSHRVIHFFQDFQSCKQVLLEKNESGFSNRFQEKKRRKRKRERNYSHYRCIRHEISKLVWWWIVGIYWTMNLRIWLHILIGIDNWWLMKRNVIVDVSIYKIYKDTRIFCENIIEIYYSN